MKLKKIYLKNFRNHEDLKLTFDNNVTYIYGDNGLGKTNILEAIYFLSTTKSLKASIDKELINHKYNFLISQALIENEEDSITLEATVDYINSYGNRSIKKVKINSVPKSIATFAGNLKAVLFTPSDLDTLFSSTSYRRKYLDAIFYQISEEYKRSIIDYTKALKQRNKILELYKETKHGMEQIDIWTEILIREGSIIQKYRERFFDFFHENIDYLNEKLNLSDIKIELNYLKNEASKENFERNFNKEIYSGNTACGPHKDDFEIIFNSKDISKFGSRGQQRICVSILKFGELDFIYNETKQKPVLLLDDVFSELDDINRQAVLNLVSSQQTIITSVYPLEEKSIKDCNFIDIRSLIKQQ